jgi:hypothetical protein
MGASNNDFKPDFNFNSNITFMNADNVGNQGVSGTKPISGASPSNSVVRYSPERQGTPPTKPVSGASPSNSVVRYNPERQGTPPTKPVSSLSPSNSVSGWNSENALSRMKIKSVLYNPTSSSGGSPAAAPSASADLASETQNISSGVASGMEGFRRDPSVKPERYFDSVPEIAELIYQEGAYVVDDPTGVREKMFTLPLDQNGYPSHKYYDPYATNLYKAMQNAHEHYTYKDQPYPVYYTDYFSEDDCKFIRKALWIMNPNEDQIAITNNSLKDMKRFAELYNSKSN